MTIVSKYNNNVFYNEYESVYDDDDELESTVFRYNLMGEDCEITLGRRKTQKGISFYPIYLVCFNNCLKRIGIIELDPNKNNYFDKNGVLNLNKVIPKWFYFVNSDYIVKTINGETKNNNLKINYKIQNIPDIRKDIFITNSTFLLPPNLFCETKDDALKERSKYIERSSNKWIQRFMHNLNYSIQDNEGGGDCFFASVRDAFSSIGQYTNVSKLRKKLSDFATDEVYHNYRHFYDSIFNEMNDSQKKLKMLEDKYVQLKNNLKNSINDSVKKNIYNEAKEIYDNILKIRDELEVSNILIKEFQFIKNINNLHDFKKLIMSCKFWAENWTIQSIEEILNVKFIILSSENYQKNDIDNVLLSFNSSSDSIDTFNPEFYIILDYNGNHYKLIGYKNHFIFTFDEIPYDLKIIIKNKCLENLGGNFLKIPQFSPNKQKKQNLPDNIYSSNLFSNNIVFILNDANDLPGKAPGENIPNQSVIEYSFLNKIPKWRKKLCNNYISIIEIDHRHWASVEHYLQANKFKNTCPEFYESFAIESKSLLSQNPEMAKSSGSSSGKYLGNIVRPKHCSIDPLYNPDKFIDKALLAKFTQHPDLKRILLETKNAKLMNYKRGKEPILAENLMIIRKKIESL
uniref:NADAR domain-containing protein n=1 Tax=viral metagenome TaxID=1070528 RepID=A0A6C0H647_9ZZZZ